MVAESVVTIIALNEIESAVVVLSERSKPCCLAMKSSIISSSDIAKRKLLLIESSIMRLSEID